MDEYFEDLQSGRIQIRDKWQFELKSELFPFSHLRNNVNTQEFYFFVPNSLQINDQTYTKAQFYLDQTNLIRFKTPSFSFQELNDEDNTESPFVRILLICDLEQTKEHEEQIEEEVKLLGNIFHSTIRNKVAALLTTLEGLSVDDSKEPFAKEIETFCHELETFRNLFKTVHAKCLAVWPAEILRTHFDYVDEFISINIGDYLSGFLHRLRLKFYQELNSVDHCLCDLILREKKYREAKFKEPVHLTHDHDKDEYLLYRKGLLNKFIIDPLLLKTNRAPIDQRFRTFILGIPAALAMLIFMILYVWQGNLFLINSEPFVVLTVILYVLKDRMKEELRLLSYRQAAKWFSDYTTEIKGPNNGLVLGLVGESFSFVDESQVPNDIVQIRNREFHDILEEVKRPERIIYYKKTVNIKKKPKKIEARFYGFSIIFRFDIHHFLTKAEDPFQTALSLDPEALTLRRVQLPRVYHLNVIIKNSMMMPEGDMRVELKKFRLIIDKNGIKRVESF